MKKNRIPTPMYMRPIRRCSVVKTHFFRTRTNQVPWYVNAQRRKPAKATMTPMTTAAAVKSILVLLLLPCDQGPQQVRDPGRGRDHDRPPEEPGEVPVGHGSRRRRVD